MKYCLQTRLAVEVQDAALLATLWAALMTRDNVVSHGVEFHDEKCRFRTKVASSGISLSAPASALSSTRDPFPVYRRARAYPAAGAESRELRIVKPTQGLGEKRPSASGPVAQGFRFRVLGVERRSVAYAKVYTKVYAASPFRAALYAQGAIEIRV
eukprot:7002802-Pyramimonas_sp.AAC.2